MESALSNLQKLGQKWERGLFATGGAINLQKSFWVLMAWKWKNGQALLLPPSLHSHQLALTSGYNTNDAVHVPQLSPYASYRTLGAYLSPLAGWKKRSKSSKITQGITLPVSTSLLSNGRQHYGHTYFISFLKSPSLS
jgi:hypothetical protein